MLKITNLFTVLGLGAALVLTSLSSFAAPTLGPVYPAPNGNDWVSNGVSAADGTSVYSYSNFDLSGLDSLYFGLNQVDYGLAGAGLNGSPSTFNFISASGDTAVWEANTDWDDPGVPGTGLTAAMTRLTMTVSSGLTWSTDLAGAGLDDVGTFGPLGAVVDNSAGVDFDLTWAIEGNTGSGWQALNSIQQPSSNQATRSSVGTGFYYVESAAPVPVPATLSLFAAGIAGLGWMRRRKA